MWGVQAVNNAPSNPNISPMRIKPKGTKNAPTDIGNDFIIKKRKSN